jgi:hypothetical protein
MSVNVDFQDGQPQQSMTRAFAVDTPAPPAPVTEKVAETPPGPSKP